MVLRAIEQKIESLFEGIFGRAFRTNVQPVELARKLAKEMDEHKTISVSRVYVPNEYTVYLSPDDREQFSGYEDNLKGELQDYLSEHSRRENYALLSPVRVLMETDADLDVGEFGIATRMVQPDRSAAAGEPAGTVEPGSTMIYKPKAAQPPTQAVSAEELGVEAELVTLSFDGTRYEVKQRRVVIGRSRECDIQLSDTERVPAPRRAAPGGCDVLDRRPRVDERRGGQRPARQARKAQRRRHDHRRVDRGDVRPGIGMMVFDSVAVDELSARPQDRVPRPALPVHLADRADCEP